VVLGDLAESGEGVGGSNAQSSGFDRSPQVGLLVVWRPWLALFASVVWQGFRESIVFRLNVDPLQVRSATTRPTDCSPGVAFLLCLASALTVWSWTCGFVLGSLSGRAVCSRGQCSISWF